MDSRLRGILAIGLAGFFMFMISARDNFDDPSKVHTDAAAIAITIVLVVLYRRFVANYFTPIV